MSYTSRFEEIIRSAQRGVKQANGTTADRIAAKAKVDAPKKTGKMADSIKVVDGEDLELGNKIVECDFPGHLVEFGSVHNVPAKPFLGPAAEAERERHQRAIGEAFH